MWSTYLHYHLSGGDRPSLLAGDQLEIVQSYPNICKASCFTLGHVLFRGAVGPYVCMYSLHTYVLPIMNPPRFAIMIYVYCMYVRYDCAYDLREMNYIGP